jgi:tyrosine-specific transport protein
MDKKLIQIVLFIAGNAIGAGVLGLPVTLGGAGFWPSLLAIFILYGAMLHTGQILANCVIETRSFDLPSLFQKTLGKPGVIIFSMAYFTLFFCLLVAYWTGLGSIFSEVSFPCRGALFLVVTLLLFHGFRSIGPLNVVLTGGFIIAFTVLIFSIFQVKGEALVRIGDWGVVNRSLAVILCSYGFHGAVPFVCSQLDFDKKSIEKAITWGAFFPFLFNVIILWASFRALNPEELARGLAQGLPVFAILSQKEGMHLCALWGQIFSFFAIITSLIGVSLTMGNALQDCFSGRAMKLPIIGVTVFLPFIISFYNPSIFIRTLEFSGGILLNIIAGILPLIVRIRARKSNLFRDVTLLIIFSYILLATFL